MSKRAAISWETLHEEGFYPEESSGLFVGISRFEDERFAPVRFAVDDAIDLAWVFAVELGLLDARRCVLALSGEPQKKVSGERLAELVAAGARSELPRLREVYRLATELSQSGGERGLFLLMAATHGLSDQGGDYLVAADSLRDRLLKTGIEVKDLFDLAAKAMARRRLVLLDACRERLNEGTSSLAGAAMSKSFAGAISRATGLTVLSATTAGGYAYDDTAQQNGVFSGALVEGLRGAAPADERGFITVATLAKFAQGRLLAWVRVHRQEHLKQSRGIQKTTDEWAEQLPLSIDPQRSRTIAEYQRRRALALIRLKENIGEILDGRSFEDIKAFLPAGGLPSPMAERLLKGTEALDGGEIAQRSLLHLFWEVKRPQAKKRGLPNRWTIAAVAMVVFAVTVLSWSWLPPRAVAEAAIADCEDVLNTVREEIKSLSDCKRKPKGFDADVEALSKRAQALEDIIARTKDNLPAEGYQSAIIRASSITFLARGVGSDTLYLKQQIKCN